MQTTAAYLWNLENFIIPKKQERMNVLRVRLKYTTYERQSGLF